MENPYFGTTASEVDYYFGTNVFIAKLWHSNREIARRLGDINAQREGFIVGIEEVINGNFPEHLGVTRQNLREIIKLAQGDWRDKEVIDKICGFYDEIRPNWKIT